MRTSLLSALAFVLAAAPAAAADRTFPLTGFDRVRAAGSADVIVSTGGRHAVSASGSEADLDRLDIRVEGGTLVVAQKPGQWRWGSEGVTVRVTAPAVTGAAVQGSGNMRVDRMRGAALALAVAGSGDLMVPAVEGGNVELALAGSGDIEAAGRCQAASILLRGSGDIRADRLACETLSVALNGSGDVAARASGTANVALNGSGDVVVSGGARCTTAKRGSGDIRCS